MSWKTDECRVTSGECRAASAVEPPPPAPHVLRATSDFGFRTSRRGFTLMEVMIAMGIFFMAVFAILGLVSNALRNARALQETEVDASMLAAELSITNKLYDSTDSGDFGDMYRNYSWSRETREVGTNGLFEVDFTVHHRAGGRPVDTTMSVLLFRPESPPGGHGIPIGRP